MRLYSKDIKICKEPWARSLQFWFDSMITSHQLKYGVVTNSTYIDLSELSKYTGIYLYDEERNSYQLSLDLIQSCCPDVSKLKRELVWAQNRNLSLPDMSAEQTSIIQSHNLLGWFRPKAIPIVAYAIPYGFVVYLNKPAFEGFIFEFGQTVHWTCGMSEVEDLLYSLVILIARLRMAPVELYLPKQCIPHRFQWTNKRLLGFTPHIEYNRLTVTKC